MYCTKCAALLRLTDIFCSNCDTKIKSPNTPNNVLELLLYHLLEVLPLYHQFKYLLAIIVGSDPRSLAVGESKWDGKSIVEGGLTTQFIPQPYRII
jgi:hypothetical protein